MREIVGAQAVIDGKAAVDLRRPRARPLPAADPAHEAARRLHRPADDAVLLPGPARTRRSIRAGRQPAGSGPYYVAERVVNQRIVLKRNPYYRGDRPANVDQVVWTIGMSREDCLLATEQDRIDHCVDSAPSTAYRALAERYGINRPGGQFFVSPRL